MRYRKSIRDIAKEAVETVYKNGAGHARALYESERDEQARRFRKTYGSDSTEPNADPDQSNVAAYFIGVFDTVAALGSGRRRLLIQLGIAAFFTLGIAIPLGVAAILPALVSKFAFGLGFWWSELALTVAFVAIANIWFWWKQQRAYRKEIYDFPNKGATPGTGRNGNRKTLTGCYRNTLLLLARQTQSTKPAKISTA